MKSRTRINVITVPVSMPVLEALQLFSFVTSTQKAQSLLDQERVRFEGNVILDSSVVVQGELELLTSEDLEPVVDKDIQVIYEDEWLLVVNKPAPLPVHAAGKYYFNTCQAILEERLGIKLFTVHRLDRETSGVLVFAKDMQTRIALGNLFAKGQVQKQYLGVVKGVPDPTKQMIRTGFETADYGKIRHHIFATQNAPFFTTFIELEETTGEFSILRIKPVEGQKHQIRVHLASVGMPLLGDKQYFRPEWYDEIMREGLQEKHLEVLKLHRQALHAYKLTLHHPKTGEAMTFEAKLTGELREFIAEHFDFLQN
jgi:23S rRNA pseudouridine1911/1915/1917 synthase